MENGPVLSPNIDPASVARVKCDVEGVHLRSQLLRPLRAHEQRPHVQDHGAHEADGPPVREPNVLVHVALAVQHGPDDERAPLLDGDELKGGETGRAGRRRSEGLLPPATAVVLRLRERLYGRDGGTVAVLRRVCREGRRAKNVLGRRRYMLFPSNSTILFPRKGNAVWSGMARL